MRSTLGWSALCVALLGDDALVQVHPGGVRHVRADGRVNEWKPPKAKPVVNVPFGLDPV